MRSAPVVAASLACLSALSGAWRPAEAQAPPELAGGWIVTSWTAPAGTVNSSPQRGLFIRAASGQYSMTCVPADAPDVTFGIANDILTLKWLDGSQAGQTATLRRPTASPGNPE